MQRLGMLTIPGSCHPTRCLTPRWSHPLDVPSGGIIILLTILLPGILPVWCMASGVYGLATGYVDQRVRTLMATGNPVLHCLGMLLVDGSSHPQIAHTRSMVSRGLHYLLAIT